MLIAKLIFETFFNAQKIGKILELRKKSAPIDIKIDGSILNHCLGVKV
jgi:hypothetical protein